MNAIVLPTDFSKLAAGAASWAVKMAEALDAEIHCLYVARDVQYYGSLEVVLTDSLPTSEEVTAAAERQLAEHMRGVLGDADVRAVPIVRVGTPFVEIIRYAREIQAKMIVMSTHGHSGLKHMLLGSTTEAVVRKADCPVLSIRSPEMGFVMP